jgi:23S rRNA (pseudouridine1915-N3)-methyltransferase
MLDLIIIAVGGMKETYFKLALNEYLKRLKPYARIKIIEVKSEAFNKTSKTESKRVESQRIKDLLDKYSSAKIYLLDERGEELTSVELAQKLEKLSQPLVLVIGGSLGFSEELLNYYPKLALSKLTFLHEMTRVILLEQIYRAITIIKGKDYHH